MATLREFVLAQSSLPVGNTIRDHIENPSAGGPGGFVLVSTVEVELVNECIDIELDDGTINVELDSGAIDVELDNEAIDVEVTTCE